MGFKHIEVDKGWSAILKGIKNPLAVKVGILDGTKHPEGDGKSIAELAMMNEYGTSVVPSRPAWRQAIEGGRDQIVEMLERSAVALMVDSPGSQRVAMARVGGLVQRLIRESIDRLTDPPNSAWWIRKKGSDKPLIWTKTTRNAVRYEVIKGGKAEEE